MTNGRKKTTIALSAAVVLASAGYAVGSGAGGGAASAAGGSGSATAANVGYGGGGGPRERGGPGPGRDLSDLASRLGTTEAKLRAALDAVRDEAAPKGDRDTQRFSALASALGKSAAEVEKAFEQVHAAREEAFAASLAKELGIEAAKAQAALAKLRADRTDRREGDRRERFTDLASELGVSTEKLRGALRAVRPERPGRGEGDAALAKALGVTEEQLDAAEEKARAAHEAEHEQRAKAFAAALAKELGISATKVEDELGDRPFFGGRRHHG